MRKIFILLLLTIAVGISPAFAQGKSSQKKKPATTTKSGSANKQKSTAAKGSQTKTKAGTIAANKIDTFRLQVDPLVKFFESSLNFLGDRRNSVSEKQTIISQSYLKWCWDDEVQVEDDLDENRLVPLYKDMPAYLSDIDFFFKSAKFQYTIQDVSVGANQEGNTYFKVTANRNLKGINLNGDSVNNNKVRYIEINYDDEKQQLKIVSVYSTKLNEKDELRKWWNDLSMGWKAILAKGMKLEDSLAMEQIESFNDSVAIVGGQKVFIMGSEFYKLLGQIIDATSVDLSGDKLISDLEPLSRMSNLTMVNISGTPVSDLMPLRNLNHLEVLDISNTNITNLSPLRYCLMINQLRMRGTLVSDLTEIPTFKSLTILDVGNTIVSALDPLQGLTGLVDLRVDHTKIQDIAPVSSLVNLEMLNISSTSVEDLSALKPLSKLRILYCDSTGIKSLEALDSLSGLERVYCDYTSISQKQALNFVKKHPETYLVYASRDLEAWWSGMTPEWQNIFHFYSEIVDPPTIEQLHKLALLDSINITGRMTITSLQPLSKLILLRNLQCPSTGITSMDPLNALSEITLLNISNTQVSSLKPLSQMGNLEVLNIDNTPVADVTPLYNLAKLKLVFADNTKVDDKAADNFADKNPECLMVYQTFENSEWWKNLDAAWQDVFLKAIKGEGTPDKIQLQEIAGLKKVVITENFQIADLTPVQRLTRLTELDFSGTTVSKLDPLTQLTKLQSLRFRKNPVNDLTPVAQLQKLKELDFANTQVEDIEPLQNMVQLEILKFSGTQVKNLKYLQKLRNLQVMEFYNTRVVNVDVLDDMNKLKSVKMFNTKVSAKRVEKLKAAHPGCEIIFY